MTGFGSRREAETQQETGLSAEVWMAHFEVCSVREIGSAAIRRQFPKHVILGLAQRSARRLRYWEDRFVGGRVGM